MNEATHRLRTFCAHARALHNKTERSVYTFNFDVGSYFEHSNIERLSDITKQSIENYLIDCKLTKDWSAKTIRNRIASLRSFLRWCEEQGYVGRNVALDVPLPEYQPPPPKPLSKVQAEQVLYWSRTYQAETEFERHRAMAIIGVLMHAGLRNKEVRDLDLFEVDLSARRIFVRCGKGQKSRYVPISDELLPLLATYIETRKATKYAGPAFFFSESNGNRIGEKVIDRIVKKLRHVTGIYFTAHMLRHTFATMLVMGGASLNAVKELMGHSCITTTMLYVGVAEDFLRSEINKSALGTKSEPFLQMISSDAPPRSKDTPESWRYQHAP